MELIKGFYRPDSSEDNRQLLELLDKQPNGVIKTTFNPDLRGGEIRFNEAAEKLLGFDPNVRGSARWLHLVHPSDHASLHASRVRLLQEGGSFEATIRIVDLSEGEMKDETRYRWIKLSTSEAKAGDGRVGLLDVIDDVTEIGDFAFRDALTGLFNRRFLKKSWTENFNRLAHKNAEPTFMGFMLIDIDHLKQINDHPSGGHHKGDEAIITVSDFLTSTTRGIKDIVCRLGGDEFAILSPESSLETMRSFTIRLYRMFQEAFNHERRYILGKPLTLSIGFGAIDLSQYPNPDENDLYGLLSRITDAALYQAKNQGRNRAVGSDGSIVS